MNPLIVPRESHNISRKQIPPEALKVLYGLHRAGFCGYLCGGGVRDLMVGLQPKDFDVATDASPEMVKKTFRNSRIIGRRFRLAHVFFQDKIIEVSTFRRRAESTEEGGDLLIKSDNTYGTAEEDAERRDFTINALFYDIGTFSIIDYVGGLADLKQRVIRSIGEPAVRFQEDPVRMIRAVKLAARLNFTIDEADWTAIRTHARDILKSSSPRLLEEMFKILKSGAAANAFRLLEESGLMDALLPELRGFLEEARGKETGSDYELYGILSAIDHLKDDGHEYDNAVYLAALLAPWLAPARAPLGRDSAQRIRDRMEPLQKRLSIGKRDSQVLRNVLVLQHRLGRPLEGRPGPKVLEKRRAFPLAVDLAEIRAISQGQELPDALAEMRISSQRIWDRRGRRIALLPGEGPEKLDAPKRRRRRRRRGEGERPEPQAAAHASGAERPQGARRRSRSGRGGEPAHAARDRAPASREHAPAPKEHAAPSKEQAPIHHAHAPAERAAPADGASANDAAGRKRRRRRGGRRRRGKRGDAAQP